MYITSVYNLPGPSGGITGPFGGIPPNGATGLTATFFPLGIGGTTGITGLGHPGMTGPLKISNG
jgi:hypothetical protein